MLRNPKLAFLAALLASACIWFYVQRVLIPYEKADALAHSRPRGILSDLYPRWMGARALLLQHEDPYSDEVTREIQIGYYGRLLDSSRSEDPKDQQRFAYPVYVVFLLAPTVHLSFPTVQAIFRWGLGLATAIGALCWLRFLRWCLNCWLCASLIVLVASCFPSVQGIKLQQLSLLVGALLAATALSLATGRLFLAGALLALATIKPQLAVLLAAWLMLWTLARWRQRQSFFLGFGATLAILVGGSEYLLPGWMLKFVDAMAAYERYTGGGSLLDLMAGRTAGALLAAACIAGTAVVCWRARRADAGTEEFAVVTALVLAVTVVVVPMMAPYNQVLLVPAIFLILRHWRRLWSAGPGSRIAAILAAIVVLWPWPVSLAMVVASLVWPPAIVQRAWAVPLWTSIAVPILLLPLIASLVRARLRASSPTAATPPAVT